MSHDDFAFEPQRGLPAALPRGEHVLWQGAPDFKSLAYRAYHVRKVAFYFSALVLWRIGFGLAESHAWVDVLASCLLLITLGGIAIGVLTALAYFSSRGTVYTITSKRVLIRHGIAVPMTMNVPFNAIDGVALKEFGNGTGDVALTLPKNQRIGYLITWPHLRPGRITQPQPSFRALPDAKYAATLLGDAVARDAGLKTTETRIVEPRPEVRPTTYREPQPQRNPAAA